MVWQKTIWLTVLFFILSACGQQEEQAKSERSKLLASEKLTVYKTPSCGCCGEWVSHIQQHGFNSEQVNQDSIAHIKDLYGVPSNARSCHTAISKNGYVFEGHVPAKFIEQFLDEKPTDAKGLLVPAMPLGSPGMEYQNQFNPYTIYMLMADGNMRRYADINHYQEQF